MHYPLDELRKLIRTYSELRNGLESIIGNHDSEANPSLAEQILRQRTLMVEMQRMDPSARKLLADLKSLKNSVDAGTWKEMDGLLTEARYQAAQIHELCSQASEIILISKNDAQAELEKIGRGKQYLKSVNPIKFNYPKFIDSTG